MLEQESGTGLDTCLEQNDYSVANQALYSRHCKATAEEDDPCVYLEMRSGEGNVEGGFQLEDGGGSSGRNWMETSGLLWPRLYW